MGSKYPRAFYDEAALTTMEQVFREVWKNISLQRPYRDTELDEDRRDIVVRKMMELMEEGITEREDIRRELLRRLPLDL